MIAKNHCLMQLRNKNHQTTALEFDVADESDDLQSRIHLQQKDQMIDLMHEGLAQLNDQQRQCIAAFYLHKKSYREIAEVEGISLMQVKSAIQNGKRNIRKWVESILVKS